MPERQPSSPISFKVRPQEYCQIQQAAEQAGMTISSYVRSKLLAAPITATMFRRYQLQKLMM